MAGLLKMDRAIAFLLPVTILLWECLVCDWREREVEKSLDSNKKRNFGHRYDEDHVNMTAGV